MSDLLDSTPHRSGACERTRRLLATFLKKGLAADEERDFRAHVVECEDCRHVYRRTIATAAAAKRTAREAEERAAVPARIERQERRKQLIATTSRRFRRWRLTTMLLPAALVVLLAGLPFGWRDARLELAWEAGAVEAGGFTLDAERDTVELTDGQSCITHGPARVALEGQGARFTLGADTRVIVVEAATPRLRLQAGTLTLTGSGLVEAQLGLVELEGGEVELDARGARLAVECRSGAVRVLNAGLEETLGPGQRALVGLGEIVVQPAGGS